MVVRKLAIALLAIAAVFAVGCGGKKSVAAANPTEVKEFFDAVDDGDATIVDRLLRAKPYLANVKNSAGKTPLVVAREKDDDELVSTIQRAGGRE